MDDKSKKSHDLAEIEKEIEKKVTPIKTDETKRSSSLDLNSLRKIAQRIQKFEDSTGVAPVPGH